MSKIDIVVQERLGFGMRTEPKGYTIKEFVELLQIEHYGDPDFVKKLSEGDVILETYNDYCKRVEETRMHNALENYLYE
mgnify:FL=1|jgi:hypothetical protein|tara:strand:+ start:213 stop:449 length:237 start_codon:yes stop_codon:yes gene_type:complete